MILPVLVGETKGESMAEIEITDIRKDNGHHDNPHEAATRYRWVQHGTNNASTTDRSTVVGWLDNGINGERVSAYVERVQPRAYCFVNTSAYGTRFLQTRADATPENNLLRLPEC